MSVQQVELGSLSRIRTGKLDANASSPDGAFPFFTCAREPLKIASYSYDCECVLIAGNGDLNVKYHSGKFDAYQRTYIVESVNKSKLDVRYLFHFMDKYLDQLREQSIGGIIKYIKIGNLTDAKLPLPPVAEQRRIAAILDKADALRTKRREAIAKLDQLLQSVFLEMFGDPVTNPRGWPKRRMSDLMSIVRGGSPRPIEKFLGGHIPWIKIGDATKGDDVYIENTREAIVKDGLRKTRFLKAGSVIFANCGVSLGFARILKIDGCIHDGWLAFQEIDQSKIDDLFLLKALNSITEHFRRTAPDGTQPNLNTGIMNAFEFILPPIELQRRFSDFVRLVRSRRLDVLESESAMDHLISSIQQQAFAGTL